MKNRIAGAIVGAFALGTFVGITAMSVVGDDSESAPTVVHIERDFAGYEARSNDLNEMSPDKSSTNFEVRDTGERSIRYDDYGSWAAKPVTSANSKFTTPPSRADLDLSVVHFGTRDTDASVNLAISDLRDHDFLSPLMLKLEGVNISESAEQLIAYDRIESYGIPMSIEMPFTVDGNIELLSNSLANLGPVGSGAETGVRTQFSIESPFGTYGNIELPSGTRASARIPLSIELPLNVNGDAEFASGMSEGPRVPLSIEASFSASHEVEQ